MRNGQPFRRRGRVAELSFLYGWARCPPLAVVIPAPRRRSSSRASRPRRSRPIPRNDPDGRYGKARHGAAPPGPGRGVDAELRVALYDIATDRALAALNRWSSCALARRPPGTATSRAAVNRRQDPFLLAQTYYRLGVGERFRGAAQDILNASHQAGTPDCCGFSSWSMRTGAVTTDAPPSSHTGAGVATDRA